MAVISITGVSESRTSYIVGKILEENPGQQLIIAPTYIRASRLAQDISFFADKKVRLLQSDDETFIGYEAKNKDTLMERLKIMQEVVSGENIVVVAPLQVALKKLIPKDVFVDNHISFKKGDSFSLEELSEKFIDIGYERVPMVYAKGQFSVRGEIIDVFSPFMDVPARIEFFDIEVESIRTFDPDTQRSLEKLDEIVIYPAEIMIREKEAFERAYDRIGEAYAKLRDRKEELQNNILTMSNLQHMENYMDYFYDDKEYIWDYMDNPKICIDDPGRCYEVIRAREREFKEDFEVFLERGLVVKEDYENFPGVNDYLGLYDYDDLCLLMPLPKALKGIRHFDEIKNITSRQMMSFNGKMDVFEKELKRYLSEAYEVTVVCSGEERYKNIQEFLERIYMTGRVKLKEGTLTQGLDIPDMKVAYITDKDIFGTYKLKRRKTTTKKDSKYESAPIKSFAEIRTGDFVVHENHGIGKFEGMVQMEVQGEKRDYLKVKYAGEDYLYVPAEQMSLIQRYIGAGFAVNGHKINRLSGTEWKNTKSKAKAAIVNMAKELLEVSAKRKHTMGYQFSEDTPWQKEFEEAFPFEETGDQLKCIREIKADMEKPQAMDRLLCGDVGYGKTEVATRAIFKAVCDGKQVAILVPTTILANQHYNTLKKRFDKFPFTIDVLSRFRSDAQQAKTVKKISRGNVDVVVGTHRLLSKDIDFKDLGLLVIDEEQRFGVQHKEAIKKLKSNVDVLILSATPIPRTLHMSLLGIRDMSLIEEPPLDRYPVQTYVMEEDDYIIREAIQRELDRKGQVFIIYNRVSGVHMIAERIKELVPEAKIGVGHGQMSEVALEDVMMSFINGEIDILVATTIIESGIDIPNVNTEIIMNADKFGVSQLYQLRGRVGRSNRLAYAYLMHKKDKVLSDIAQQRLRAIKDFTEFGAGFKIAMRDLEIRGAGNILGTEQSGHLVNVGYEFYCKLVDDAVKALKGEVVNPDRHEATVSVNLSAYIPEYYITDEVQKLSMYKKIASVETYEDEKEIFEELLDRFGEVPKETEALIKISHLRALACDLDLELLSIEGEKLILSYPKKSGMPPVTLFLKRKNSIEEALDILDVMKKGAKKN